MTGRIPALNSCLAHSSFFSYQTTTIISFTPIHTLPSTLDVCTCPCMFMMVMVLLRLQTTNWSATLGSGCTEFTVTSCSDPDSVPLKVLTHSVVFVFHSYTWRNKCFSLCWVQYSMKVAYWGQYLSWHTLLLYYNVIRVTMTFKLAGSTSVCNIVYQALFLHTWCTRLGLLP